MGWKDAPEVQAAPAWASAPEVHPEASDGANFPKAVGRAVLNAGAGALRGAGSIGATLLAPVDIASDAIDGKGISLDANRKRRAEMDAALRTMGADTDSVAYGVGKLGGEIAGTAGAGGVVANVLGKVPGVAAAAPNLLQAIRTSGMSAGSATGPANMLLRTVGGGIAGGATAGMVNPDDAAMGAGVGAALPGALKTAGTVGNKIGSIVRGPAQPADLAAAIDAARQSGYVIPPTQANPSLVNRMLEGFSGKLTTAQNASAKNQSVTNRLAAESLGLAGDTKVSPEVLDAVRKQAGEAYANVAGLGKFDVTRVKLPGSVQTEESISPLLAGKVKSVDAGEVVRAWRQANADATAYFRAYGRDANPETLAKAKAAASAAKQIHDFMVGQIEATQKAAPNKLIADLASGKVDLQTFLQKALELAQQGDLAQQLKDARVLIAKTHSVEGAMNPTTGAVDARKLAAQLAKGKPLSRELKTAAEFAGRFPKAAQTVEGMGSLPQTSPLDWVPAGALSMATSNPLMMLGVGARPAARALTLSPVVQNRLVQSQSPNALQALLANQQAGQLAFQAAPNVLNGR